MRRREDNKKKVIIIVSSVIIVLFLITFLMIPKGKKATEYKSSVPVHVVTPSNTPHTNVNVNNNTGSTTVATTTTASTSTTVATATGESTSSTTDIDLTKTSSVETVALKNLLDNGGKYSNVYARGMYSKSIIRNLQKEYQLIVDPQITSPHVVKKVIGENAGQLIENINIYMEKTNPYYRVIVACKKGKEQWICKPVVDPRWVDRFHTVSKQVYELTDEDVIRAWAEIKGIKYDWENNNVFQGMNFYSSLSKEQQHELEMVLRSFHDLKALNEFINLHDYLLEHYPDTVKQIEENNPIHFIKINRTFMNYSISPTLTVTPTKIVEYRENYFCLACAQLDLSFMNFLDQFQTKTFSYTNNVLNTYGGTYVKLPFRNDLLQLPDLDHPEKQLGNNLKKEDVVKVIFPKYYWGMLEIPIEELKIPPKIVYSVVKDKYILYTYEASLRIITAYQSVKGYYIADFSRLVGNKTMSYPWLGDIFNGFNIPTWVNKRYYNFEVVIHKTQGDPFFYPKPYYLLK